MIRPHALSIIRNDRSGARRPAPHPPDPSSMLAHAADHELLQLARDGDERAFRELVERYEPAVASVVVGMLGAGDDADDVGQETFIRFYRALGSFRGEASLKTYLRRIAMNLSL